MSLKYRELMERVELNPAMRQRILADVLNTDTARKTIRFHTATQVLSLAACAAVLAVGVVALPDHSGLAASSPAASSESEPMLWAGTESFSSLAALVSATGIDLPELQLPFEVQQTEYTLIFGTLAQVEYIGAAGETLSIRAEQGTEDVSGDYSTYDSEQIITVGSTTVTLKSMENSVQLAIWQKDGISYAISSEPGLTQEQMLELVRQCG